MPRTVTMDGRTEDEYRLDINRAIADTEDEIFREAMGDEELDNDGDNSLEEMGEGPGGDHLDDEDVVEEYDTEVDPEADQVLQAEPGEPEEADEGEEEGEEAEEGEQEGYEQPPYQEPQRGVPSYRALRTSIPTIPAIVKPLSASPKPAIRRRRCSIGSIATTWPRNGHRVVIVPLRDSRNPSMRSGYPRTWAAGAARLP